MAWGAQLSLYPSCGRFGCGTKGACWLAAVRSLGMVFNMTCMSLGASEGGGWKVLNFVTQGERDMAAVNYGRDRFYVHRLVAYNTRCAPRTRQPWGNPLNRAWPRTRTEVHHHRTLHAPPREPWRCSRRLAMVVWLKDEHCEWHRLHPGVDWPFF